MAEPDGSLNHLVEVMARLRAECDWKAAQTHLSLTRYLLEEAYETVEAIESGAATGDWAHLREELGDVLLQVVFHAEIARERGDFDLGDVAADLVAKLRRRNPHVFGDAQASGAASVNELWESVKATEKRRDSVLDGLPPALPALLYADKVLDRLDRAGALPEVSSTGPGSEIGDRLLALVAEARAAGVDPEQALRAAVRRLL